MKRLLLSVAIALASTSTSADGINTGISYAKRDQIEGAEIELGYHKTFSSFVVNILPLTGIIYSKTNSRYREETFSNGSKVCRDTSNGQFADKENCSGTGFDYGFIVKTDYDILDKFAIGAGVRLGNKSDVFLTLRSKLTQKMSLQVKGGENYVSAGLAFGY